MSGIVYLIPRKFTSNIPPAPLPMRRSRRQTRGKSETDETERHRQGSSAQLVPIPFYRRKKPHRQPSDKGRDRPRHDAHRPHRPQGKGQGAHDRKSQEAPTGTRSRTKGERGYKGKRPLQARSGDTTHCLQLVTTAQEGTPGRATAPEMGRNWGIVHHVERKRLTIENTAHGTRGKDCQKGIAQRNRNRYIKRYVNRIEKHIFEMSKIFQKPIDRNRNRML